MLILSPSSLLFVVFIAKKTDSKLTLYQVGKLFLLVTLTEIKP